MNPREVDGWDCEACSRVHRTYAEADACCLCDLCRKGPSTLGIDGLCQACAGADKAYVKLGGKLVSRKAAAQRTKHAWPLLLSGVVAKCGACGVVRHFLNPGPAGCVQWSFTWPDGAVTTIKQNDRVPPCPVAVARYAEELR